MSIDSHLQSAFDGFETVRWNETMFEDLQWYYAEGRVYVLRCKHGTENEHYLLIKAGSPGEAISKAVFDLRNGGEE